MQDGSGRLPDQVPIPVGLPPSSSPAGSSTASATFAHTTVSVANTGIGAPTQKSGSDPAPESELEAEPHLGRQSDDRRARVVGGLGGRERSRWVSSPPSSSGLLIPVFLHV